MFMLDFNFYKLQTTNPKYILINSKKLWVWRISLLAYKIN